MSERPEIGSAVDHLFRQESGKMVAVLTKIFGPTNIQLAEDVAQEALLAALETWKFRGLPENPKAWLYKTAKNKAIDYIRKNKFNNVFDFSEPHHHLLSSEYTLSTTMTDFWTEEHIKDDFLGMMYACCVPEISHENQITFILKSLCGFSTKEVARSFLTSEDTVSKRLYRTKEYFRSSGTKLIIPEGAELEGRTAAVLNAIYLIFNEGYNSTHNDQLIRRDLIGQALALCNTMLGSPKTRLPEGFALMALMCYHTSRLDSRLSNEGDLILLEKQDRSKWDQEYIEMGNSYMIQSTIDSHVSVYHLEAAIAYEHCSAKDFDSTNWNNILRYYDMLISMESDPIVKLNRCLVILQLHGPQKAYDSIQSLPSKIFERYYLFYAIRAEIFSRLKKVSKAESDLKRALKLTQNAVEKVHLKNKLSALLN